VNRGNVLTPAGLESLSVTQHLVSDRTYVMEQQMVSDQGEAHLYVLPWLRLRDQIDFARVSVAPAASCLNPDHPCTEAARRILACYKSVGGAPVSPSLMWLRNGDPLSLTRADFDDLLLHRMCLSAGLVMSNDYFDGAGIGPITDAHCDGRFHRFSSDAAHVAIYKRRREGQYLDGWPLDRITITVPLSASPGHHLGIDHTLLDALVTTISGPSPLGKTLERALPPFLQGNRLSEQTTVLDDLVWMGAAFERLLGVSTPIGEGLADAVNGLFDGYTQGSTNWINFSLQGNPFPDSGPWRKRWMREFYVRRSALHSGESSPSTWTDLFHSVIAAELFSLAVKRQLEQSGQRQLSDTDRVGMDALDCRIEVLAIHSPNPGDAWHEAGTAAARRAMATTTMEALRTGDA
jgi:hypothetical protein